VGKAPTDKEEQIMTEVEPTSPPTPQDDPAERAREIVVRVLHTWVATAKAAGRVVGTALSPLPVWGAAGVLFVLLGVAVWLLDLARSYVQLYVPLLSTPAAIVELVVIAYVVTVGWFGWRAWVARTAASTQKTEQQS